MFALFLAVYGSPARAESTAGSLAVVVNKGNPVTRLDAAQLEMFFTLSRTSWPGKLGSAIPLNYAPRDELREAFDRAVLGMSPDEATKFWLDQRIRHGTRPPRQIGDARLTLRLVARLPGAIGYVPAATVDATVKVVAWIRDGKVVKP